MPPTPDSPSISLALGSGGARGLAHIGVIRWLDANGYRIESISGSSMGALIGGIYAMGKLDTYSRWVTALRRIDILRLLDPAFSRSSLFKGERIIDVLRDLIGDRDIEELPVRFTAVATDLDDGSEIWIQRGPLFEAIRASIALPTIFSPCTMNERRLVDGGLTNPVPITPTLDDATDLRVAVNLSAPAEQAKSPLPSQENPEQQDHYRQRIGRFLDDIQERLKKGKPSGQESDMDVFDIISKSIEAMQNTIAEFKLEAHRPDLTVNIPRNVCTFYEFHRAEELIEIGRQRTEATFASLQRNDSGTSD